MSGAQMFSAQTAALERTRRPLHADYIIKNCYSEVLQAEIKVGPH